MLQNPNMTAQELYNQVVSRLKTEHEPQEAQSMSMLLLEHFFNLKRSDLVMGTEVKMENSRQKELEKALNKLQEHEPLQYILGKTEFYGREFRVTPDVLIPRPETEELVHLIIKENKKPGLKVMDIGTGTGCIPITLDKEMPSPEVYSIDISEDALKIARENAAANESKVKFFQSDVFANDLPVSDLDIVVSNPPYVRETEKTQMQKMVLEFEPRIAIFVPDNDPLIFYRRITQLAAKQLKKSGKLYFEINEAFGKETADLLKSEGFQQVVIFQDMQGKDRIVKGVKQ
jgi:release factor glutamine methyltransferase